jgi:hypothetical protein
VCTCDVYIFVSLKNRASPLHLYAMSDATLRRKQKRIAARQKVRDAHEDGSAAQKLALVEHNKKRNAKRMWQRYERVPNESAAASSSVAAPEPSDDEEEVAEVGAAPADVDAAPEPATDDVEESAEEVAEVGVAADDEEVAVADFGDAPQPTDNVAVEVAEAAPATGDDIEVEFVGVEGVSPKPPPARAAPNPPPPWRPSYRHRVDESPAPRQMRFPYHTTWTLLRAVL